MTPIVTANGTNYATLTIGGVAAPVCNVSATFGEADTGSPGVRSEVCYRVNGADVPVACRTVVLTTTSEWTPEFQVWYDRLMSALGSVGVVRYRPPRWLRLWQRRHEKAKAKREKTRAARYAARWEQAHLRGGK